MVGEGVGGIATGIVAEGLSEGTRPVDAMPSTGSILNSVD